MTIRRHIDAAALNTVFMAFEEGCENAPEGTFEHALQLRDGVLGYSADEFLRNAKRAGFDTCNCDGIREIEVLMFDMIRRSNPNGEIDNCIAFGLALQNAEEFSNNDRGSIIRRVARDKMFTATRAEWQALGLIPPDDADSSFTVEQQADQSWAVFHGGGWQRGGFADKDMAWAWADARAEETREAMA